MMNYEGRRIRAVNFGKELRMFTGARGVKIGTFSARSFGKNYGAGHLVRRWWMWIEVLVRTGSPEVSRAGWRDGAGGAAATAVSGSEFRVGATVIGIK